jgi:hypothetical protein
MDSLSTPLFIILLLSLYIGMALYLNRLGRKK